MRTVLGLVLLAAGLIMGVVWLPAYDGERQLAVVTEIATQGIARVSVPSRADPAADANRGSRTFSPQTPLISEPRAQGTAVSGGRTQVATTYGSTVKAVSPTTGSLPATAQLVVTTAQPHLSSSRPLDSESRAELVRNLQRELKRVGCYAGEVDGDWGSGSKRAMSAFTERVNASLPADEPDYILLTLVQGHTATACGKGCPLGQSMTDANKCAPNSVVAQNAHRATETGKRAMREQPAREPVREPAREPVGREAETIRTAALEPAAQRNSLADAAVTAGIATATGTAVAAAVAGPLPGRMSIGAVRTDPDVNAPPPSAATDAVRQSLQSWQPGTPSSDSGDAKAKSRDSREAREPREREPREQSKPRRVTTTYSAALGVPPRPVFVYREPPRPRQTAAYYAPAPRPRQASSRAWTAHFFDRF